MSKDEPNAIGIAGSAAGAMAAAAAGDPVSASAGILEVVQRIGDFHRARQVRILKALLLETYGQTSADRGAFAEYAGLFDTGELRSDVAKEVFLQSVRAAEAAVEEAVYPALAMLMREYVREGKRADGFFRGISRTLQDVSADEYESLRAIVVGVARWPGPTAIVRRLRKIPEGYFIQVTDPGMTKARGAVDVSSRQEDAAYLFHLLEVNNLAERQRDLAVIGTDTTETNAITMHQDIGRRIAALVDPAAL